MSRGWMEDLGAVRARGQEPAGSIADCRTGPGSGPAGMLQRGTDRELPGGRQSSSRRRGFPATLFFHTLLLLCGTLPAE